MSNEENVEIRLASWSDAALLARLRYDLRSALRETNESETEFVERCTAWMQQRLRGSESWRCWIATVESAPVGSIWAQLVEKIPNPIAETEYYVYVTNFYVREEYRGRGIGSRLLTTVKEWGQSNDAHSIILWPTERSKPLYLRHGFKPGDNIMQLTL